MLRQKGSERESKNLKLNENFDIIYIEGGKKIKTTDLDYLSFFLLKGLRKI